MRRSGTAWTVRLRGSVAEKNTLRDDRFAVSSGRTGDGRVFFSMKDRWKMAGQVKPGFAFPLSRGIYLGSMKMRRSGTAWTVFDERSLEDGRASEASMRIFIVPWYSFSVLHCTRTRTKAFELDRRKRNVDAFKVVLKRVWQQQGHSFREKCCHQTPWGLLHKHRNRRLTLHPDADETPGSYSFYTAPSGDQSMLCSVPDLLRALPYLTCSVPYLTLPDLLRALPCLTCSVPYLA
jgi:hypothetical protein